MNTRHVGAYATGMPNSESAWSIISTHTTGAVEDRVLGDGQGMSATVSNDRVERFTVVRFRHTCGAYATADAARVIAAAYDFMGDSSVDGAAVELDGVRVEAMDLALAEVTLTGAGRLAVLSGFFACDLL